MATRFEEPTSPVSLIPLWLAAMLMDCRPAVSGGRCLLLASGRCQRALPVNARAVELSDWQGYRWLAMTQSAQRPTRTAWRPRGADGALPSCGPLNARPTQGARGCGCRGGVWWRVVTATAVAAIADRGRCVLFLVSPCHLAWLLEVQAEEALLRYPDIRTSVLSRGA